MLYRVKNVDGKHRAIISFPEKSGRLNAESHACGIQVHALDGCPEYALREMHHIPLSLVDSVVEFNLNSNPESRFDGVHFDNEPHLLVGRNSPTQRKPASFHCIDMLDNEAEEDFNKSSTSSTAFLSLSVEGAGVGSKTGKQWI